MRTAVCRFAVIVVLANAFQSGAIAQTNYPSKPIRLLVGFAPGGLDVSRKQGSRLRDATDRESAAAAVLIAQTSIPRSQYPERPIRLLVGFAPGLDVSSEQGSRLRDATDRESAVAPVLIAQASIPRTQYPERPIRLLVGFAPGGGTDTIARIVAQRLGEVLGQQVVIDNRAGANQIIASEIVAGARPDGYTLFMASAGFAINPALQEKLPFDSIKDFAPITMAATAPNVLVVQPSLAVRSIPELIALARQKPGQLLYGSGGVGTPSHLSGALFASLNKIRLEHVPYKGSGPALAAMLGGEFQIAFPQLSTGIPHIKSGKLVALGVTTSRRSAFMPDLPTVAESGTPGYEASSWAGLMGPAGLPKQIVIKLSEATNRLLKEAETVDKLFNQGAEVVGGSPEQFAAVISREIAQWKKLVVAERIK